MLFFIYRPLPLLACYSLFVNYSSIRCPVHSWLVAHILVHISGYWGCFSRNNIPQCSRFGASFYIIAIYLGYKIIIPMVVGGEHRDKSQTIKQDSRNRLNSVLSPQQAQLLRWTMAIVQAYQLVVQKWLDVTFNF